MLPAEVDILQQQQHSPKKAKKNIGQNNRLVEKSLKSLQEETDTNMEN